jgi:flagellar biosynthesis component FlhA
MSRLEDTRSIGSKILHGMAKVLVIMALGAGLTAVLGDVGIPARALGMLSALAIGGTAVLVGDYASAAERQRCQEERRAIEEEDRKVDAFVAEHEAGQRLGDLAEDLSTEVESRFVRLVEAQRQPVPSWKRVRG